MPFLHTHLKKKEYVGNRCINLDSREKGTENILYETHLSPPGSQCIDLSDELAPNYTCICRMGLIMEGGRCIIRPPTTPASNIIVTLEPEKAEQAAFLTGSSSFVLIGFVTGKFDILFQLGSLAGPVIQGNGRLSFE